MSTYRDLLQRLVEHPDARAFLKPRDLPELTLHELVTVMGHYPTLFVEAIADADPQLTRDCADALEHEMFTQAYRQVGLLVVGAFRYAARRMVLLDLQVMLEARGRADAIERQSERPSIVSATVRMFAS